MVRKLGDAHCDTPAGSGGPGGSAATIPRWG